MEQSNKLVERIVQEINGADKKYGCCLLLIDIGVFLGEWRGKAKNRLSYTLTETEELLARCSKAVKLLQAIPRTMQICKLVEDCINTLEKITDDVTKQINTVDYERVESFKKITAATEMVRAHLLAGATTKEEEQLIISFTMECLRIIRDHPELSTCCTPKARVANSIFHARWWLRGVYNKYPTLIINLINFGLQLNNPQIDDLVELFMEKIINDKS